MKNKQLTIIIVVFIGITIAYLVDVFRRPCSVANISIPVQSEDSKVAVGQKIMNLYLKNYKYRQTCPVSWLKSYKIDEVKADGLNPQSDKQFTVAVSYSVKPRFTKNYWGNGNGKDDSSGWINQKFSFLTIENNNGFYKLQGLGTGP